ncbi:hypothetical protein [Psychromonas sp.]|uniref:hypothetical protein n=1 Tax=Psychromonas sp. TaxID=1884585 RepID=UPI00356A4149
MKNIQFKFSLCVAIAINVPGALIAQQDPAGFALISVGIALIVIAVWTKKPQQNIRDKTPYNMISEQS